MTWTAVKRKTAKIFSGRSGVFSESFARWEFPLWVIMCPNLRSVFQTLCRWTFVILNKSSATQCLKHNKTIELRDRTIPDFYLKLLHMYAQFVCIWYGQIVWCSRKIMFIIRLTHTNGWESMGKPCSCMQFIKSRVFPYESHKNPYQYCKSHVLCLNIQWVYMVISLSPLWQYQAIPKNVTRLLPLALLLLLHL